MRPRCIRSDRREARDRLANLHACVPSCLSFRSRAAALACANADHDRLLFSAECDVHSYKSGINGNACVPCPNAPNQPGTTSGPGATSAGDCECEPGYGKQGGVCTAAQCGAVSPEVHTVACDCPAPGSCNYGDGIPVPGTCNATCDSGYAKESGTNDYKCGPVGVWIPANGGEQLVCTAAVCSAAATGLPSAGAHVDTTSCADKISGATCTVTCDAGYTGSGDGTYTCASDGTGAGSWSDGALVCAPVQCPAGTGPSHATALPIGNFDDTRDVTCHPGYVGESAGVTHEGEVMPYACGADAHWGPQLGTEGLTCTAKRCTGSPTRRSEHVASCGEGSYGDGEDGQNPSTCTFYTKNDAFSY